MLAGTISAGEELKSPRRLVVLVDALHVVSKSTPTVHWGYH